MSVPVAGQYQRILDFMSDGNWRTLNEIAEYVDAPVPSVSAQLRHMRNGRWSAPRTVDKRNLGGLWEYRLCPMT